jgi:aspartyl-tRNA(Asn)/glutamyl-tRNA(Gln) amidotransferase subunit A
MALFASEHETIQGVGRAIRAGQTTCARVLEQCFERIEEWEPRIKAWVRVDRAGALEQARTLDAELAAGNCRGPLHGIPFGIKDIIDVRGLPTAAGFGPWRNRQAEDDAEVVVLLRKAGAVIVGKTVTTQFAWIDPPPTRNPWNLDRTPGGSSSGSAAAVAVGMCLGAIGSQTGGSIIRPAAFCGVCGLKPAYQEVSEDGVFPFAPTLDHPGPFARSVGDLKLILDAIRSPDLRQPEQAFEPVCAPSGPHRATPPRLGRLRGFFDRRAEPAMTEALEAALTALVAAGAEVFDFPDNALDFEAILRDHRVIMASEAAAGHAERFAAQRADYAPKISALIGEGLATSAPAYLLARHARSQRRIALNTLVSGAMACDALVMPATVGPAPDVTSTGDPALNSAWSYLGRPAVAFPIGLSPDGLPLAIQLVDGREGMDLTVPLLETASWCEDVIRCAYLPSARSE